MGRNLLGGSNLTPSEIIRKNNMKKRVIFGLLIFTLLIFAFSLLITLNYYEGRCPEHFVYPKNLWVKCSFWEAYKFILAEEIYNGWWPGIYWYPPSE